MTYQEVCEKLDQAMRKNRRLMEELREVEQILGKALRYPWFVDDQANFPGVTAGDGVCVGEHTVVTLAEEAAARIEGLENGG